MARIVGVHGVGKQRLGSNTLLKDWEPALADGLDRAGGPQLVSGDLHMAFYGDLFPRARYRRRSGSSSTRGSSGASPCGPSSST